MADRYIPHEHICRVCGYLHGCDNPRCKVEYLTNCLSLSPNFQQENIKFEEHQRPAPAPTLPVDKLPLENLAQAIGKLQQQVNSLEKQVTNLKGQAVGEALSHIS